MVKMIIKKAIKKHGLKGLLIMVGDIAVKVTKTKEDDVLWAKIKKLLK